MPQYDEGFEAGQKELAEQILHGCDVKAGQHQTISGWVPNVCRAVLAGQRLPVLKGVQIPPPAQEAAALPPTGDPIQDFIDELEEVPEEELEPPDAANAAVEGATVEDEEEDLEPFI
jgi:hypothetical protein